MFSINYTSIRKKEKRKEKKKKLKIAMREL